MRYRYLTLIFTRMALVLQGAWAELTGLTVFADLVPRPPVKGVIETGTAK